MVSFYGIIEAGLLFINALVILNEHRFLKNYGLGSEIQNNDIGFGISSSDRSQGVKPKIAATLSAMRTVLRFPLIFMNLTVIVLLLLFG